MEETEGNNPNTNTPAGQSRTEGIATVTPSPEGHDSETAPRTPPLRDRSNTPPLTRDAIESIGSYEYELDLDGSLEAARQKQTEEEAIATALIMFSPVTATTELPKLRTGNWPYGGEKPNPISIGTARKLLAAGLAEIPCELEAAGDHGYAWIIEDNETWEERVGVKRIEPPSKPKEVMGFDMRAQFEYAIKSKRYSVYKHLCQEGKAKITDWFGEEMFVDLFVKGSLPPTVTPKELLAHLATTYATPQSNRMHMELVEEQFNSTFSPKEPVEAYFMRLQEARVHAEMLGVEFTNQQTMNRALKQFELRYEKDAYKAEKKWNEKPNKDRTWPAFKVYWKEQIQQWDMFEARGGNKKKHANQVDIVSLVENVAALQAETRSLQIANDNLTQQLNFQNALQSEHVGSSRMSREDDISTITNNVANSIMEGLEQRIMSMGKSTSSGTITSESTKERTERLQIAKNRNPKDYSRYNGGKGKRFSSYCWKCGCNCTHWTKKCLELSENEKQKYKAADFDNTMGGSTKFMERRGKYQADYEFDSL